MPGLQETFSSTDAADFTAGPYMLSFSAGATFPLTDCASIPTATDDVLEGDHSFFVTISDITPDGAVMVGSLSITEVTINDLNGKSMLYYGIDKSG